MNRSSTGSAIAALLATAVPVFITQRADAQGTSGVRFVVAEVHGRELWHDSYTLVLTAPADIAHARALVANGISAGEALVIARIAVGADGLNRNWTAQGAPPWHWHLTQFLNFADASVEILDGTPTGVEANPAAWIAGTQGLIGFWNYTVVAELPPAANPACPADFNGSGTVSVQDLFDFLGAWFAASPLANVNGRAGITVQDLFDFLGMWFAGCA